MPKLPTDLSGQDVRTALERRQFEFRRQKGSHMILGRSEPAGRVVVPDHKHVRVGTLRKIISQAGLTVEDFLKAVEGD
jgi:predicted RNA binding protein YcfA (HicA-like mRNA interferase family)